MPAIATPRLSLYSPSGRLLKNAVRRWSDRVSAAGGSVSGSIQSIVNEYFERPIIQAGLKSKIKLCYLFAGAGANTHKVPYIGSVNATPVNCVDADFVAATGFTGNGTSKYLNLGVSPAGLGLAIDNMQLIAYGTNLGGNITRGILTATGPGAARNILYRETDQSYRADFDANAGNVALVITAVASGMIAGQSPSPAYQRLNLNGVNAGFDVNSAYRTGASSTGNLIALAYDNAGSIILHSPASLRWLAVSEGMSDFEMALLYEIVDQFNFRLANRSAVGAGAKTLSVTKPTNFHFFQRRSNGKADIPIQGYYSGTATTIEARWNGGSWTAIATVAGTGVWRGTLFDQSTGQGTLEVRASNAPGTVVSKTFVTVGSVFGAFGQSNAAGQFNNPQAYSHPTLKVAKFQKYRTYEEYVDPSGAYIAGGTFYGPLATILMAQFGIPVAFINCGVGSTTLVTGSQQWNPATGTAYDQAIYTYKMAESGGLETALLIHGETDSNNNAGRSLYKSGLDSLVAGFKSNFGAKTLITQVGEVRVTGVSAPGLDNVRAAVVDAWNTNPDVMWGPCFYDIDLGDDLHFTTDAQAGIVAGRVARAIAAQCYNNPLVWGGRGPRYLSGSFAGNTITINFQDGVAPLVMGASPTTGWAVSDGSGARTISAVNLVGAGIALGQIQVVVSGAALSGSVTVSLGSSNSGVGNTIKDSGFYPYPIEPFSVVL